MFGITLDRNCQTTLARQIYQTISKQILCGALAAKEALPSTRELARLIGVSRNTVCEAYEMLLAEGYIISRQGAPTRVAEGVAIESFGQSIKAEIYHKKPEPLLADFNTGRADLHSFPRRQWLSLLHNAYEQMPLSYFDYSGPDGLFELRYEIAAWLLRSKGLNVKPEDIFITAGATHALHIIGMLLCGDGKGIYMEDPCHIGMLRVLMESGYTVFGIPVDEQGIKTDLLKKENASCIYVTPSHQFPLGGILPAVRRAALIRFARENVLFIIEDDYDSEFRYCGEPVAPLYSMDNTNVIYVGTFSKVLFPALRIGYAVVPRILQNRWKRLRTLTDVQNPPFEQAALAEFLRTRKFDKYIRRMRRIYSERRNTLISALKQTFKDTYHSWGDAAGLHIALEFPGRCFDTAFYKKAKASGIRVIPVDYHCIKKGAHLNKLLLGYGHLKPEEITAGIKLLYELMQQS